MTCTLVESLDWTGSSLLEWVKMDIGSEKKYGWMDGLTDLLSGGGWVSAPHIQFENALFFIIKQVQINTHNNRAFFFI